MIKMLTLAAALVAIAATVTTAQSVPPRIEMPSQGLQLGPQIKPARPIPGVPPQDRVQPPPETPQVARGYYKNSEGRLELYPGCHWVDPHNNSDLRTYCD
jgi:hypothetical protein